ncbi:hypothetical protein C1H76_7937 [Elsinoe australis]|uniref:Uncharacterized protein n=1 Tax=Elsinoe australis TaxID=40998 RepID=A0A4U7APA9_9PEZI|nr:hypothetical protein C1H76_7937 [Elsinoe australis]
MAPRTQQTILAPTAALPAMTANPLMTVIANNIQQQHEQIRFMLEDGSRQYEHQAQQYVRQAEEYLQQVQQYGQRIVQQYGQQYGHLGNTISSPVSITACNTETIDQISMVKINITRRLTKGHGPDHRIAGSPGRSSQRLQTTFSTSSFRAASAAVKSSTTATPSPTGCFGWNLFQPVVNHGHITSEQRPTAERVAEQLAAAPAQTQSAVALAPVQTQTNREPDVASAPPTLTIDNLGTAAIVRPIFPPSTPLTDATVVDIRPAFPPAEPLTTRPVSVPPEDPKTTACSFRPNA